MIAVRRIDDRAIGDLRRAAVRHPASSERQQNSELVS
jgi:hypothetical protein